MAVMHNTNQGLFVLDIVQGGLLLDEREKSCSNTAFPKPCPTDMDGENDSIGRVHYGFK